MTPAIVQKTDLYSRRLKRGSPSLAFAVISANGQQGTGLCMTLAIYGHAAQFCGDHCRTLTTEAVSVRRNLFGNSAETVDRSSLISLFPNGP